MAALSEVELVKKLAQVLYIRGMPDTPNLGCVPEDDLVEELIDDIRLGVRFLVFDLEATRRENLELRRLLDETLEEPH